MQNIHDKLNSLSKQHLELKSNLDKMKKEDDKIRDEIKEICKTIGIREFEDDNGYVLVYRKQSRKNLSREKMQKFLTDDEYESCFDIIDYDVLLWKDNKYNDL